MLTGGVGYTYSLSSAPPLVQTNVVVPGYPYNTDGKKQGGLSVPAPNVWKVATGFTGRRAHRRQRQVQELPRRARRRADLPRRPAQRRPDLLVLPQPRTAPARLVGGLEVLHPRHPRRPQAQPGLHLARDRARPRLRRGRVPGAAQRLHDLPRAQHLRLHARPPRRALRRTRSDHGRQRRTTSAPTAYTVSPYVTDATCDYGAGFSFAGATGVDHRGGRHHAGHLAGHRRLRLLPRLVDRHGPHEGQRRPVLHAALDRARRRRAQEQCLMCHGPGKQAAIGAVHMH